MTVINDDALLTNIGFMNFLFFFFINPNILLMSHLIKSKKWKLKDSQTSLTLFFALFSKLIVYKYINIKYILHHVQKLKWYLCQKC